MEQDFRLYEYRFWNERFTFEAPSQAAAELYRPYAYAHFKEVLPAHFAEEGVRGPFDLTQELVAYMDDLEATARKEAALEKSAAKKTA